MTCLILFCGCPAVGKTTFAQRCTTFKYRENLKFELFCFDELYPLTGESWDPKTWKKSQENMFKQVKESLNRAKFENEDVIRVLLVDDNFYYESMRHRYHVLAKMLCISYGEVFLSCSLENALDRNSRRTSPVSDKILREMFDKMEYPDPYHGWQYHVNTDKSLDIESSFVSFLEYILNNPQTNDTQLLLERERDRQITHDNSVHQIDLAMRKIIHDIISSSKDKVKVALRLAEKRKYILSHLEEYNHDIDKITTHLQNECLF
jgi:tRNA uridine 5-carbamoylmethylation protein Kti12